VVFFSKLRQGRERPDQAETGIATFSLKKNQRETVLEGSPELQIPDTQAHPPATSHHFPWAKAKKTLDCQMLAHLRHSPAAECFCGSFHVADRMPAAGQMGRLPWGGSSFIFNKTS
jgi:hypothetical protein